MSYLKRKKEVNLATAQKFSTPNSSISISGTDVLGITFFLCGALYLTSKYFELFIVMLPIMVLLLWPTIKWLGFCKKINSDLFILKDLFDKKAFFTILIDRKKKIYAEATLDGICNIIWDNIANLIKGKCLLFKIVIYPLTYLIVLVIGLVDLIGGIVFRIIFLALYYCLPISIYYCIGYCLFKILG